MPQSTPEIEIALIRQSCGRIEQTLERHSKILEGNGVPGLVMEVHDMKASCLAIQEAKKKDGEKNTTFWNRYLSPVYASLVPAAIVAVLMLIVTGAIVMAQQRAEDSRVSKLDTIMTELKAIKR